MEFLDLQGEIAVVVKLREDRRGLRLAARQTQGLERGVQLGDVDVTVPIIIEVVERRAHIYVFSNLAQIQREYIWLRYILCLDQNPFFQTLWLMHTKRRHLYLLAI